MNRRWHEEVTVHAMLASTKTDSSQMWRGDRKYQIQMKFGLCERTDQEAAAAIDERKKNYF